MQRAATGQAQPGPAIGFMIELRNEHLVARLQGAANGGAQSVVERGHVLPERNAAR